MTAADEWVAQQAATWPPMGDVERGRLLHPFRQFAAELHTGEPPGPRHDEGPAPGKESGPQDQRELVQTTHVAADANAQPKAHGYPDATRTRDSTPDDAEDGS